MALVEACEPNRVRVAGACCAAVIDGLSALLLPLPLRYAAVVPAQNVSGSLMLPEDTRFSPRTQRTQRNWST
eukprot:scaffold11300_cov66-Phaeocystis_antarctica.AAC.4